MGSTKLKAFAQRQYFVEFTEWMIYFEENFNNRLSLF